MISPSPIPPSEALGKLKGAHAFQAFPYHAVFASIFQPLPHVSSVRQMCSFCCLLIFPEVVCTADAPVSVFTLVFLQFCFKIATVHCCCPSDFQRTFFTAPFPPRWRLSFFLLDTRALLRSVCPIMLFHCSFLHM